MLYYFWYLARLIRFDEQIVGHAKVEDLNDDLWKRFRSPLSSPEKIEFLSKMKLVSMDEEGAIPNSMTIDSLSERQSARNELLSSLLAKCQVEPSNYEILRTHIMDKRGEGVPIIISHSEKLSGKRPVYRLIDDSELLLTIFAAQP